MADFTDSIHFSVGEQKVLKYQFTPNVSILPDMSDVDQI
jgi:hypothetical protein